MKLLLQEIRRNPLLWLLVFVPIALAAEKLNHEAHTLHFVLSILAILPLAVLLKSCNGICRGEDRRFGRRSAERHAWKSNRACHRHRCIAGRPVHIGEGIDCRRDCDEFVVYAGRMLPARRTPVSRSGVQQGCGTISGRFAFSRHYRASDSLARVRARDCPARYPRSSPDDSCSSLLRFWCCSVI